MTEQLLSIKFNSKTKYFSMAIICICVFVSFLAGPVTMPLAYALASAAFAVTAFSDNGPMFLRIFTIAFFISLLFITDGSVTSSFAGITLFLPGGLALSLAAKKKMHFSFAISYMIIFTAAFSILTGLFFIAEYGSLSVLLDPVTNSLKTVIGDFYESLSLSPYYNLLFSAVTKRDFIYDCFTSVFRSIPALIGKVLVICSFISFAIFKRYSKKHSVNNQNICVYMGSFSFFRASRSFVVVYMIFSILYFLTANELEQMFFSTVTDIFSLIFCFESFSLLSFYLKIYNVHTVLRAIIFIFVLFLCIIPIGFSDIISLIGFADAIWNLRRFCRRVY